MTTKLFYTNTQQKLNMQIWMGHVKVVGGACDVRSTTTAQINLKIAGFKALLPSAEIISFECHIMMPQISPKTLFSPVRISLDLKCARVINGRTSQSGAELVVFDSFKINLAMALIRDCQRTNWRYVMFVSLPGLNVRCCFTDL